MSITRTLWSGLLSLTVMVLAAGSLHAQQVGAETQVYHNLGYGTERGQAVIMIFPADLDVRDQRGSNTGVEVTGTQTRRAAVGNCYPGEVTFQPARLIHRSGEFEPVQTEVAVIYPDNVQLPASVTVGAWRPGGPCGPGYQIQRGHILETNY